MYPKPVFSAFNSHFQVTSSQMTSLPGHLRSCEVISCHVNPSSCELQPCFCSNVPKPEFQAFYRHFQVNSNEIIVTYRHVTSFSVT